MKLQDLVHFLDDLLKIKDIQDESLNGLQVANRGEVSKVALAVDASQRAFERASEIKADFIFVHHGLFWARPFSLTGPMYWRIRVLVESGIALYAAHLPLDLHSELGNNAQIKRVLGWPVVGDFGDYHGTIIGREVRFEEAVPFSSLVETIHKKLECTPQAWNFGPDKVQRLGYVSGGGLSLLQQAIDAGMDAYVTGEPKHSFYWIAKEAGINVVFAGHYATETLGVKAVGEAITKELGLETVFMDLPTGH